MSQSDAELWANVLDGDERAFGALWDRHRDRTLRHLFAQGFPLADAEDLVAIVYLELWRRRHSVRLVDGSILPWLLVTARNVGSNAARARRRYHRFLSELPGPVPAPDHAELHAERNDERVTELRAVLAAASPRDASLLALTVIEGFTVSQAAEAVNISEPAARMRLSRLRTRLRHAVTAAIERTPS
ncbi:RNA polymerase sigma factor [Microbacterium sp. 2FI]|uniref:RNA polymerase sigma factor n=1 Tax=Microbacterium sp. 2FI TaxID=2502193 RepID=UPI0010F5C136|nr:RNA polymerase sigma factor [Microbacterium sp. 2FI]